MRSSAVVLSASLALTFTGAAFAQTLAPAGPGGNFPASALITVSNFARPGMLIEIQGVAVIGG